MQDPENTSYIFIPVSMKSHKDFSALSKALKTDPAWQSIHDEITYMLKYVADKINSNDPENCQCFHYRLREDARSEKGLGSEDLWFTTKALPFRGGKEAFRFQIREVDFFTFSTGIGILAYRLHFASSDPIWIASAQYYLKKVSRERIRLEAEGSSETTLLDLAKGLLSPFHGVSELQYFYYANPSTERANVLTYLEVPAQEHYNYELFYLRRCYHDSFVYTENPQLESEEIYTPAQNVVWGISPEAAVCLACPEKDSHNFIRTKFYKNFHAQYLFMYVLLLHQKYVLYYFLTIIGVGTRNDLAKLEDYRDQLYEFETDFVFSCVTEVPQYQLLYDRMSQAFSLKRMYEDVHEPIRSLAEVRRAASEKKQKKQDDNVNKALFLLSLLSFFSALVDSFDFANSFFGWFFNDIGIKIVQVICIAAILVMTFFVFRFLIQSKHDK